MKALKTQNRKKQGGVAAIEFALIFVILFTIFYALVSYTFPLLMVQAMNHAASEAARAALTADPFSANFNTKASDKARDILDAALGDIPGNANIKANGQAIGSLNNVVVIDSDGNKRIEIALTYDYAAAPLVPALVLPGGIRVPKVPDELKAKAVLSP